MKATKSVKPKEQASKPQLQASQTFCPFCNEGRLAQSPSGKNLVCQKCGRIVVKAKDAQAV